MKKLIVSLAIAASAFAVPALSFAQSNGPVTRAEVRADLVRLEHAGYNPAVASDTNYPADIQAAEAKVAAQEGQSQTKLGFGGVAQNGTSAAGHASRTAMNATCVGPVSFCKLYFGS